MTKKLRVTLLRSRFGRIPQHRAALSLLKLKKIGKSVEVLDTPSWRGLIRQVAYLVSVEAFEGE